MPFDMNDPEQSAAFRKVLEDAIDQWLDKQFSKFGRWTLAGLLSVAVAGVSYLYLGAHGFKP